jgi:alpha-tubulin suppressor-like RCC1 family protein
LRIPLLIACASFALTGVSDLHVGCSPTLTCSLRPERFAPAQAVDAGPQTCDLNLDRCAAAQVSAGQRHTCALTDAKDVVCWGNNSLGQRGPTLDGRVRPNPDYPSEGVGDAGAEYLLRYSRVLAGAQQVAAGSVHTCALLEGGSVMCWGRSAQGQVDGRTDRAIAEEPTLVELPPAQQIDGGDLHSCAVVADGVMCWGSSQYGQTGREPSDPETGPRLVAGTEGAVEVATGVRHTCARTQTGEVSCWGELVDDDGRAYITATPVAITGLEDPVQISAGGGHSCALTRDFRVQCWGRNDNGQLGDGSMQASAAPVLVRGLDSGAGQVAAGGGELDDSLFGHSCAVDRLGQVQCWGHNDKGQLGIRVGPDIASPQIVELEHPGAEGERTTLGRVARVDTGVSHGCALSGRDSLFCWGDNTFGQLGPDLSVPAQLDSGPKQDESLRAVRLSRFGQMR